MDDLWIALIIIISAILLLVIILQNKRFKKQSNKTKEELLKEYKKEFDQEQNQAIDTIQKLHQELDRLNDEKLTVEKFLDGKDKIQDEHLKLLDNQLANKQNQIQGVIDTLEKQKQSLMDNNEQLLNSSKQLVDEQLKSYYTKVQAEYECGLREAINLIHEQVQEEYCESKEILDKNLSDLKNELSEFQAKRDAINEQILRERAVEEQKDFYRICLGKAELEDIDLLNSIKCNLHQRTFLDKIIYDTYINRYVKEMIKRVLNGENPSGIYKVTNIETNEVYIGKSTTVADRWQNHTKSCFGLEGVAESQFQRALKKYGVQNFTWELLEKVPKENLTEREKYYITFYNTTKYGYNQKVG